MAKTRMKRFALAAGLLVASIFGAGAAGLFPGFPIVGSAAYCLSFLMNPLTGAVTTTCNMPLVPAGPAIVTGNETWPADTNLAAGLNPQTVSIKPAALGTGPYEYNAPLTGASITVAATSRRIILEPAGTIATLTIVLPASTALIDNQHFGICTTQIVTALTITAGAGTTVSGTVTALAVPNTVGQASCPEWTYRLANTTWYRIH